MSDKLFRALAWAEKMADAVKIAVPAINKIISIFGNDQSFIDYNED